MSAAARGELFVISAPSGAGKSTLVARLMDALPRLVFSVSWTTRAPRAGEVDGVAYHFTDDAGFRSKMERGELLEWATVHDSLYGTGRAETLASLERGDDVVLDIDVQGAEQVRLSGLPASFVFILPPSREVLTARLMARGTESPASLARRLANARAEIACYGSFDHVVVNDDLDGAAADLVAIVRAARCRRERRDADVRAILAGFNP
jgi:guanylate kinase